MNRRDAEDAEKTDETVAKRAAACPVDPDVLAAVRRRAEELSSGKVTGRPHDEVMAAARQALRQMSK